MYFYLSIGTNIHPEASAVAIVRLLCQAFSSVGVFPFRYTEPEEVALEDTFLNALAVIYSRDDTSAVKAVLNEIEAEMGRDRSDPQRSVKNRTADLDILACSPVLDFSAFAAARESYIQACLKGLGPMPNLEPYGLASYQRAATINIDALTGQIIVVDDELDCFKHWVEATFKSE